MERFWKKVRKTKTCWLWTAMKDQNGYGRTRYKGRPSVPAHRVAYELEVGPIPEGLELDHLCRNTSCVNPSHLEPVTHAENIRRGYAAQSHCRSGEHRMVEGNIVVDENGHRLCRQCAKSRFKKWRDRNQEALKVINSRYYANNRERILARRGERAARLKHTI